MLGLLDGDVKEANALYLVLGALGSVAVGLALIWAGYGWFRGRIREEFSGAIRSDEFSEVVGKVVSNALLIHTESVNAALAELKKRDDEQAGSIASAHRRIDAILEKLIGGVK